MKVVLTGAGGMLGHDIGNTFHQEDLTALNHKDLDVTDLDRTLWIIRDIKPDLVIHAAAYTDVDGSELESEKAIHVNGIGTRNVTMACEENACRIIYISSDYVFDGSGQEPYSEWAEPNPINKYGLSKLIGENYVSSLTNRFYIVRTSWLYGRHGKNFVDTIIRLSGKEDEIKVVNDQVGSPTYTYDLAARLKELPGQGYGTYHITNSSHCSWYEFALEIVKLKGLNVKMKPVTSDEFRRPARRPSFSVLDNSMLRLSDLGELRDWKDALKEYLS